METSEFDTKFHLDIPTKSHTYLLNIFSIAKGSYVLEYLSCFHLHTPLKIISIAKLKDPTS